MRATSKDTWLLAGGKSAGFLTLFAEHGGFPGVSELYHQSRSPNFLCESRREHRVLHLVMCLSQLRWSRRQQALSPKGSEKVPACLETFWIFPSSRKWREPPSHPLGVKSLVVPVCCQFLICALPPQMGKSALAQESSPLLQEILQTPWCFFLVRRGDQ